MPDEQLLNFRDKVTAVACATRAVCDEMGFGPKRGPAVGAAGQAILTPGVLVRVACGSLREFREQLDLVNRALFGFLVDPRQLTSWISGFEGLGTGPARSGAVAEGITFELLNGSGVRVFFDADLARERRTSVVNEKRKEALGK